MKRYNYAYQEAENGLEALHAYEAGADKFQTILMDMSMPISTSYSLHLLPFSSPFPRISLSTTPQHTHFINAITQWTA